MWAPADLFTPAVSIFLFPLKEGISFFYQRPMALAATVIAVAALITVVTMIQGRRARGT